MSKGFSDKESLGVLNKDVREWFTSNFKELTMPQSFTFKLVSEHKNILVAAPTGSGKTMSGFVAILSDLFNKASRDDLKEGVYCIYVSPLRALNNDIYKNLSKPLEEIYKLSEKNAKSSKVTIAVRTGDTPQKDRQKQLKHPPHILVTTPESLAILITSEKFAENLKLVEYVVIDEIHELANNKRGVHLSLSLERLRSMIGHDFTRIGLGATLYPLDEAAKYLVGCNEDGTSRDCVIIDASWGKKLQVQAISPVKDMIYTPDEKIEQNTYSIINDIIKKNKSTLIFTNTRSGTERVVFNLKKKFGYNEDIAAHHGSLSRESRLEVEELLKAGSLKCAVSSTSLELGIDIGSIDDVIQLGSPKSVTRAVQRIGRAGHKYKSVAKGEIIVLNRDDLVECSIMLDAALKRHLDSFRVPMNALDILSQHIVGMSITKKWDVKEAYSVIKSSYPYSKLPYEDFIATIRYLSGEYVGLESRRVYGKIWYDEKENMFGRRGKYAKLIYMLNLGTIPDEVAINVFLAGTNKWIGNIEEEFLARMKPGDIFTLGGRLYKFSHAKGTKCYVEEAKSASPTIPPWFSEQLPLSYELGIAIGKFRKEMSGMIREEIDRRHKKGALSGSGMLRKGSIPKRIDSYLSKLPIDKNAKSAIYAYFAEQELFCGLVPNNELILVEYTSDNLKDSSYLVFHSLFGRRVNDALSRAFAVKFGKMTDEDISIMVNDNGFVLFVDHAMSMSERKVKKLFEEVLSSDLSKLLKENIRKTELMKRRFRHVAARSFMILKNYKGWKQPIGRQQVNAQLLLNAAEEIDPDFPIIRETYREIFGDLMDINRANEVLSRLKDGKIKYQFISTDSPSPFAHSMLTFGHADVVMMKERQQYLKYLHKMVLKKIKSVGK
jgi:ATP-dependent Lhr-like helicase